MPGGTASGADGGETGAGAIGARLREARIGLKLNAETVAETLHLDVDVIRAIENGETAALPAPIFVQGYLRSYARLVGLPAEELVREFNAQGAEPPPISVIGTREKMPRLRLPPARTLRRLILLMLVLILLWLAWPFAGKLLDLRDEAATEALPGRLELPPAYEDTLQP